MLKLHLGEPRIPSKAISAHAMVSGNFVVSFPVNLPKILKYLETKRDETGVEISPTHIAIKAAAVAIRDTPAINGHTMFGAFYASPSKGVDVSITAVSATRETMLLKIIDAEEKTVDNIASELRIRARALGGSDSMNTDNNSSSNSGNSSSSNISSSSSSTTSGENVAAAHLADRWLKRRASILRSIPNMMRYYVERGLDFLGSSLGLSIPVLGVQAFPLGVCCIVSAPNSGGSEMDTSLCLVPDFVDSSIPVHITLGGVRMQASQDADKKITLSPVLNVSVAFNTRAAPLSDCRKFCSRMQYYMEHTELIDRK
jgi:hypothetical protein